MSDTPVFDAACAATGVTPIPTVHVASMPTLCPCRETDTWCQECIDIASEAWFTNGQLDGYHRGLDVRRTWPDDITFRSN